VHTSIGKHYTAGLVLTLTLTLGHVYRHVVILLDGVVVFGVVFVAEYRANTGWSWSGSRRVCG